MKKSDEPILDVPSVSALTGVQTQTLYWNVARGNLRAARRNPIGLRLRDVGVWQSKRKVTGRRKVLVPGLIQAHTVEMK